MSLIGLLLGYDYIENERNIISKRITFIILILLIGILSACQSTQDSAEVEQLQQLAALESRLNALESRLEEPMEGANHDTGGNNQVFQITVATYLLDTAGFHDMDLRLNEEGIIMPGDAGTVNRVNGALAATDWPDELQAEADHLMSVLAEYAEALSNDDLEAAKLLASTAHDAQHDLSHSVENWLAGAAGHEEMEHTHDEAEAHSDHSAHHGGLLGMSGDLHLEIVSEEPGEYRIFMSDALREPINPEGVSGVLVLNPGKDHEMELPLQVMHGEHLMASGGPADVGMMDVSIRLDGTPEGHVEMDFTISYEGEHEHGEEGEHEKEHEHDGEGG